MLKLPTSFLPVFNRLKSRTPGFRNVVVWNISIKTPALPLGEKCCRYFSVDTSAIKGNFLYDLQKLKEPVLEIDNIQGDVILGFNKPFNTELIFNIKDDKLSHGTSHYESTMKLKTWLLSFTEDITTTRELLKHREKRAQDLRLNEAPEEKVCHNISFGYNGIEKLLRGTVYEVTLNEFDSNSAFVLGARKRSKLLGDLSTKDWSFPKNDDNNNDILINIAGDNFQDMQAAVDKVIKDTDSFLSLVDRTNCYRGNKKIDPVLYGHEHFGFLDGLSQPEIRGTYRTKDKEDDLSDTTDLREYIVKRTLDACKDDRYKDYSQPGYRLLDVGHFLLGYLKSINDTYDGIMQNPDPQEYRKLEEKYPEWCKDGSYVVYRKLQQHVPEFWQYMLNHSKGGKTAAGDYAAKRVGRWWDGTPTSSFKKALTDFTYPPSNAEKKHIEYKNVKSEGLLNGFQFDEGTQEWTLKSGKKIAPEGSSGYDGDPSGMKCPFSAHIRKVNPRDEFTDIGSNIQTLKHRILRRGNNYYGGPEESYAESRVDDVFNPTEKEKKQERGLALLMYNASIEDQFEFVQRHWANSTSRPRTDPDHPHRIDLVIGQNESEGSPTAPFTTPKGLGYFFLPSIHAIKTVICANQSLPKTDLRSPPAYLKDFKSPSSYVLWDWTLHNVFWTCIWASNNATNPANSIPAFASDMKGAGIGYRLPWKTEDNISVADIYLSKSEKYKSYLQFRDIKDLQQMANVSKDQIVYKKVSWQGFPKRVLDLFENSDVNPYEYVETLGWPSEDVTYRAYSPVPNARQMDEYCEWFTHRDPDTNVITRVDITAESPEYFTFLFTNEPQVCLQLYQQYISPLVKMDDLANIDGSYNVYNKWNTTHGAMHLNCPPNALFAEVYIAAEASTLWRKLGKGESYATNGKDLINSGKYGLPTRASDPTIGYNVNSLIQSDEQFIVSISDPVGLYLEDLDTTGWTDSEGRSFSKEEIKEIVHYERGGEYIDDKKKVQRMNSRIRIEVPRGKGVLGDCKIGGVSIDWAGQIIESSVTVFLRGAAIPGKDTFIFANSKGVAVVPPKDDWGVSVGGNIVGPRPRFNPLVPAPEPELTLFEEVD